jgi:hypothetical protein
LLRPWKPRVLERVRPQDRVLPMAQIATSEVPLRRCTFRRLTVAPTTGRDIGSSYAAECLYNGLDQPIPLGDLDRAWGVCQGCTNTGIFRADED